MKHSVVLFVVTFFFTTACQSVTPVDLSGTWPQKATSYSQITKQLTRSEKVFDFPDQIARVQATLLSPQWKASHLLERYRREKLTTKEYARAKLVIKNTAKETVEFYVLLSTYYARENNLQAGKNAIWKLRFGNKQQGYTAPKKVKKDRRSHNAILALFPHKTDFDTGYFVSFPNSPKFFNTKTQQIELLLTSPRGSASMLWVSSP